MWRLPWLLVALLLGACDERAADDTRPDRAPVAPAAQQQAQPDKPAELRISVPAIDGQTEEKPAVEISLPEPAPAPAQPAPPQETPEPAPQPKPAPPVQPVEQVELAAPELDLSLPEDWVEELAEPANAAAEPLLPPLFGPDGQAPVQMSGRLIPGEQENEPLIEGAEIQFEIKR